jgi:hypothetical protein
MTGWIVVWALFGCVTAIMADKKGHNAIEWFFLGALLGPFGPLLAWWQDDKKADR